MICSPSIRFLLASAFLFAVAPRQAWSQTNLAWQQVASARWVALSVDPVGRTGFAFLSAVETGLRFTNAVSEEATAANRVLLNGAGVAAGDFDNDGWPDIFFSSLNGQNTLFRNLGGWRFADVTEQAGLGRDRRLYRGAAFADLNGDGRLDLLVCVLGGGVECYFNTGGGRLTNGTEFARTASPYGSSSIALADVDGNGSLDLYVANNRTDDMRDRGQVDLHLVNGRMTVPPNLRDRLQVVDGRVLEFGEPDQLYLNDGMGRFTPVSWTGGRFRTEDGGPLTRPPMDWGLTAAFRDMNDDGYPDLYVCNDFWTPDRLWLNDGKGRFRAAPRLALRNMSASSMGVDFADVNRDGHLDFFVVDMLSRDLRLRKRQKLAQAAMASPVGAIDDRPEFMRNTLFLGRGDGTFAEAANFAGVAASEWSWSPVFLDADLDGFEDLFITTGHAHDVQDLDAAEQIRARQHSWKGFTNEVERQKAFTKELMEHMRLYPRLETPIVAFRNRGDGRFDEVTTAWGTEQPGVHHAIALADFDRDGDLDFAVNNLGSAAGIYRNEGAAPRVAVRLKGLPPNTQGIGSKIRLLGGAVAQQSQEVMAGGRYMSGSEPILVFAAGKHERGMALEVTWRSGRRSRVEDVRPNRLYEIDEAQATTRSTPPTNQSMLPPLFTDVSQLLNHRHHEQPFDEFAQQSLLPLRLSQSGPSVAWLDLDGDGSEELFIGTGAGGQLAGFRSNGRGGFDSIPNSADARAPDDITGLAGWTGTPGQPALLAGLAGYENASAPGALEFGIKNGTLSSSNLWPGSSGGSTALAVADFDGDGDLDLFVGGGPVAGRYPEAAPSRIFRCAGGRLELDQANTKSLGTPGLVNGAVWSDLNGDGYAELVLACEWGPVRIFRNKRGALSEETGPSGLSLYSGLWRGVTTGDLDGDGRLDIVAANWGWNSPYRASLEKPLTLVYGDLADRGTVELIETEFDSARQSLSPRRQLDALAAAMPFLRAQFSSHKAYSEATVDELLGARRTRAQKSLATTLASTVFFNRGDGFASVELPVEAQVAPAFSVNVADVDGDGSEDLFLSQNFFAMQPETPRLDAGRGLLLRGNDAGQLKAVPARESGLEIYGEQRGAAFADYDADGRVDLVVTQNGAATKLYRNASARAGLRVRLMGPPGNPNGVGAVMRLRFGQRWGPAREIHDGSGYRSQESAIQVLGTPERPDAIAIAWPGGNRTTNEIPVGSIEVGVALDGRLTAIPRK